MANVNTVDLPQIEAEEVLALGRMVSFVCQRAKQLNLELSTYFLEMALTSLVEDIDKREGQADTTTDSPITSVGTGLH